MARIIRKCAWTPVRERGLPFVRTIGNQVYCTIGGKIKPNESDVECLVREVREGTGLVLALWSLIHYATFFGPADGRAGWTLELKVLRRVLHSGDIAG